MNYKTTLLLIVLVPLLNTCALLRTIDLSTYPETKRTIFIQNFINPTFTPDANILMTDLLKQEMDRRRNFITVKHQEDAHLILSGGVAYYRKEGVLFDNYRSAIRNDITMAIRIQVREKFGDDNAFTFSREFTWSVHYSESQGAVTESEHHAQERLMHHLVAQAVDALEKEWIYHYVPEYKNPEHQNENERK